jgi:hypothetical protein
MSLVERQSKKIMSDALVSLAKSQEVDCTDVQLLMQFKGVNPIVYGMKEYDVVKEYTYKELYPVLVDLLNVRDMIPVFIANLLVDEAEKLNETPDKIKLVVSTNKKDGDVVYPHIYNDKELIRQLKWGQVFGQEALLKIIAKQK